MIDRSHSLPVARRARELGIRRSMDELHLEYPFTGSRVLRDLLRQEGTAIGRCHVATLMKRMAIEAIYRRPNTSKPAPGHRIYPYLLRKLPITRLNQVWSTDISYIPMARGFVYLVAIVDWFSRKVLRHRVSITDQGSQFTSMAFTGVLLREKIAISMDGRGAWRDNVVVERLWRSVKYEEVYLKAFGSVSEARAGIGRYLRFYNERRPHSSLGARTPDQSYSDNLPATMAA